MTTDLRKLAVLRREAGQSSFAYTGWRKAAYLVSAEELDALADVQETRTAIARWLVRPTRSYHGTLEGTEYGYDVAMAEIRSLLRDPSGELTTCDPSPEEVAEAALDRLQETTR